MRPGARCPTAGCRTLLSWYVRLPASRSLVHTLCTFYGPGIAEEGGPDPGHGTAPSRLHACLHGARQGAGEAPGLSQQAKMCCGQGCAPRAGATPREWGQWLWLQLRSRAEACAAPRWDCRGRGIKDSALWATQALWVRAPHRSTPPSSRLWEDRKGEREGPQWEER